jgi:AcrR family transcriptional regulator
MSQPSASRRQRLHEATAAEIKAVACDLMARVGSSSLNLRAVAREMGITPSALYRYFVNREAILTALITDAYDALGETVEQAVEQAPSDQTCTAILAAVHAFRRWALEHPQEYGLIYGTPVPGYEAPVGSTEQAAMRTNRVLLSLMSDAVRRGLLQLPGDETLPAGLCAMFSRLGSQEPKAQFELPPAGWMLAMQFWAVLYGAINAEVFRQMPPPVLELSAEFFDHTMRRALAAIGVEQRHIDAGVSPVY